MKINLLSFFCYVLIFFLSLPLSAQKLIKVNNFGGDGPHNERTYIGSEEKFTDTITKTTITKVNIVTETHFERYFFRDSMLWYADKYVDDQKAGYFTDYDYFEDDSLLVFMQNKIYDNYDASNIVDEQVYTDLVEFDSLSGNKVMQFDLKETKSLKTQKVIAYFIYDSLKWKDIRTLPLRPFVQQVIDTLGEDSLEFRTEIAKPMTYDEIMKHIEPYRNYAIDSLTSKGIDPFQYLTEMARLKFMWPYYKKNIQRPYIREAVLNNMQRMVSQRAVAFYKFTGYDFRRESAYNNLIAFKTVISYNPRNVDTTSVPQYYYDEYDSLRVRMIPQNPLGRVQVSFSQIQVDALEAAAKNLAYEMDKWYRKNWKRLYGKTELAPGEFKPIDE